MSDLTYLEKAQRHLYSKHWDEYGWQGETLYPVLLSLEDVLQGSTARLHVPNPPFKFNVIGLPRCGTMWMVKIVSLLLNQRKEKSFRSYVQKLTRIPVKSEEVRHYHEGLIEDFNPSQKVVFIYRDIRDAIISGYFYVSNELHCGTMNSTSDNLRHLSKEEGLENHIIMYMKYRILNMREMRIAMIGYILFISI